MQSNLAPAASVPRHFATELHKIAMKLSMPTTAPSTSPRTATGVKMKSVGKAVGAPSAGPVKLTPPTDIAPIKAPPSPYRGSKIPAPKLPSFGVPKLRVGGMKF
jgi:hypothetical protein